MHGEGMINAKTIESLKADFLEWTGGFEPESDEQVATYVATSMPFDLDPDEATEALQGWRTVASL